MSKPFTLQCLAAAAILATACGFSVAGVSADEAAQLKSTLTPMGAEKAGNKDGSIPAWTGGLTTPTPGFTNGGRRPDPFAADKPLYSVNAKNLAEHAAKLPDGVKALAQRHPDSFRVDVYPTRRTAAAPQYVYDNTFKNATRAKTVESSAGSIPEGAYAGVPFPIPKSGIEAMWNVLLRWRGESWYSEFNGYTVTPEGKRVLVQETRNDYQMPYYAPDGSPEKFGGEHWLVRSVNTGPAIRAGEAITGREQLNGDKTQVWVYLTGQRRVRKLPNACCDTPTPFSAGVVSFDEVEGFSGRMDRFDWKLVGKQEMLIPYNSNRSLVPAKDSDLIGEHHLNPDHVRWELHRVWVVEAALKAGQRHTSPKSRYYIDEDSWILVWGDRWDAKGQLARSQFTLPVAMPDVPAQAAVTWGAYDHVARTLFATLVMNQQKVQYKVQKRYSDSVFTPDAMAGEGLR
ncbi:DUF1329 domain-containing protein [Sphaerotilus microaerophilus]|uniref:DUF1329 domain-containing protein n=1 Tax=Sphaerotilus microaerophilus TaxID=2914710 RepID=A0ABM7YNL3_9BURK|nr:DUF1329 domain-containing protein [Sphaerotilus sp. FB-5]BDI06038.1 hypothetical protein CATMQ487_30080 [Sphaerotilus sp. FB-5]